MRNLFRCVLRILTLVIALGGCANAQNNAPSLQISKDGRALQKIVISSNASDSTRELAQTLADYLHQISDGEFQIESSSEVLFGKTNGIAVGLASEFSDLTKRFDVQDPTKTEDYLLQTHQDGALIVGASDLGLSHAVWDFLYRLGYRQFFPGKNWEIIPHQKDLAITVNTFQHPAYYSRRIWAGGGVLKENRPKWASWNARNRMLGGVRLNTGHSYGNIIRHNKAEFQKHPEYLASPDSSKLCVSNPGLQQLVVDYALAQFAKDPSLQSISMDPSDGGGWESDSCPDAQIYKSVTDRVVTLANVVAEAVNKKYPGKFVGTYAYNQHSPPPSIKVHPNVIPSIATGFIKGGYSLEELLDGWGKQSERLGIREYYSVFSWSKDLPGKPRATNLEYLARTIPHFYEKGARFMSAESGDNWGPNGLGYYIASRLLWDVEEAKSVDALREDFLEKAFGPAKQPMDKFYALVDGNNNPLFSEDLIGRMYRQLDSALKLTDNPAIRARIMDLALYTRYVELYDELKRASKDQHLDTFIKLLRYSWRIRETEMVHSLGVWRGLARYENVTIPEGHTFRDPIETNPWKSDEPVTAQEIQQFISEGIANNELREFEIKTYGDELVKSDRLHLEVPAKRKERAKFGYLRGTNDLIVWLDKPVTIKAQAGINYTNLGNTVLSLHVYGEAIADADNDDADAPIAPDALQTFELPPDKEWREYTLNPPRPGIYTLRFTDRGMGSNIEWPESMPVTFFSTLEKPWTFRARSSAYFYVPQGTKTVGGFATGRYHIYGADGKVLLSDQHGYFNVPVPEGQDGKLWEFGYASGSVTLLTVPSYLAFSPEELLLPKEVVEVDSR